MLVKRKGSAYWYCRFTAPDGSRVFQTTRTADKRQAQEYEAQLKARLWRQQQLGEGQSTWPEAVVSWLKSTNHKDDRNVRQRLRWLDPWLANKRLTEITLPVLAKIRDTRLAEGAAPATVNRYLAVVSSVLNHARKSGMIDQVPAVPRLPEPRGRDRFLSHQEARALVTYLRKDRKRDHLADMVEFTLSTGLRESNVCGLQWGQVDLARRVLYIRGDESKSGRLIRVPLDDLAVEILERRRGEGHVFTYRGRPVSRCNNTAFRKAVARLELDDVTWHTLRHSWASWQAMAGTPLQVIMELGGWSDMRMVERYAHLSPDYLAEYAGRGVQGYRSTGA